MRFLNLCPTPVKVQRWVDSDDGSVTVFRSDAKKYGIDIGQSVSIQNGQTECIDGTCVVPVILGQSVQVPAPSPGIVYIVPKDVAMLCIGRDDVVYPDNVITGTETAQVPTYASLYRYVR
jgi:hypothetical protein